MSDPVDPTQPDTPADPADTSATANAPTARVTWPEYYRFTDSRFPPIDLFEDIADPADWALLAAAEAKTNPRLAATVGALDLVPPARRVNGPNASYVMAPFVHASPDRPGRFHDGTSGAFYAANTYETALFETVHHKQKFCAATAETPGWIAEMRELIGKIDAVLVDVRGVSGDPARLDPLLDPDNYTAAQAFARETRAAGSNGIVYPSVRHDGGECFAAFWPDVMAVPVQGRHIAYHWNGERIDRIRDLGDDNRIFEIRG